MATTTSATAGGLSSSATSALSSTPEAIAKANRANAQKLLSSLGAGSGVDTAALAQNLVDAEQLPQQNAINQKITKNENKISGYAAVSYVLGQLKDKFNVLKVKSDFNTLTVNSSDNNAFSIEPGAYASTGSYEVEVLRTAKSQRTISTTYPTSKESLNAGDKFDLHLSIGGATATTISIMPANTTPYGVVSAINSANLPVRAQLINTGSDYKIMLTGAVGVANSFTMTSDSSDLSFDTNIQNPVDASIKVDGISYTRSSNTISDLIPGSTVTLKAPTTGTSLVSLDRDTTALKTKISDMVSAWNDASTILKSVSDPKSQLDVYGATLVGDSSVRQIQQQLRGMVLPTNSNVGQNISGLWQLGISLTQTGELTIDNTKLDAALKSNYDGIVTLFTNDKNLFLSSTSDEAGIGGNAVKKLTTLLGANGPILQQTQNANTQNTKYKDDLTKLQTRMDALLKRYTPQFTAMQSFVGAANSQKTSLKSTFDGMMASYTTK
jgi:flagellar hook-associated protein 2